MRTLARAFVMTLVGSLASACSGVSSLAVQYLDSKKAVLALDVIESSKDKSHQIEKSRGPHWECQSRFLCCIS